MKVFTFRFRTGSDDCFHYRFEVLAASREDAVEFLQGTERFRYVMEHSVTSPEDREGVLAALASPAVIEGLTLLDCSIFQDEETQALGA